jgi:signal transduction histidine kinase
MSIIVRLFFLVLVALTPVTAVQVLDELDLRRTREAELNAEARRLATFVGMEQDRIIEGARQFLITLSRLHSVRTGEHALCAELFERLASSFPFYAYLAATDSTNNIFCSAIRTESGTVTDSSLPTWRFTPIGFTVGDFARLNDGTGVLQLGTPIFAEDGEDGETGGMVIAGLRVDWLASELAATPLPPGTLLNITDRDGAIIAHLPRDDANAPKVGTELPRERRSLIHGDRLGTLEGGDGVGRTLVFGYNPVEAPPGEGVYIEVGLDRNLAFATINNSTLRDALALIGALLLGGLLSSLLARRFIQQPTRALLRAAGRWRRGDFSARVGAEERDNSEFARLGRAFDEMAVAIGVRETQLTLAKDQAEAASRAKSAFLANMSHELRTPLNAIIGFSDVIVSQLYGPEAAARYREAGGHINSSGKHLLRLVNDILDLSKLSAAQMELTEEWVDVPALLASCVRLVAAPGRQPAPRIVIATPDDLPVVMADEMRLKQAVVNLLANAVKFSNGDGTITLAVRLTRTGDLAITVADRGVGMKPEDIPLALQPFRQLDNRLARTHEGTGLGLPLAKMLIERHQGTLSVESMLGIGTTVTITLPRARLRQEAEQAALAS